MKYILQGIIVFAAIFITNSQNSISVNNKNGNAMSDLLKQISLKALELDSSLYSNEQIENKWIGETGCSQEDIDHAERRLGVSLPKGDGFITIKD